MYMDDIKVFAERGKELETLRQTIRIYSQDIGMVFAIEKCPMVIIRNRKIKTEEGIERPNQKTLRTPRKKENYQYLRVFDVDTINQTKMKGKIRKVYLRKMRTLFDRTIL